MYHNARFLDPPTNLRKSILPCTPLAIVKALEHLQIYNPILAHGNRLFGKTITVINRSEVNGRPLAALLANDGATVYSVDVTGVQLFSRGSGLKQPRHQVLDKEGWGLQDVLPLSDVVIGGVPVESFKVPTDLIRDGAVCVNFSSYRNFDGPAVKEKASIYVPSIGKVTIAVLLRNLVVCTILSFSGVLMWLTFVTEAHSQPLGGRGRGEGVDGRRLGDSKRGVVFIHAVKRGLPCHDEKALLCRGRVDMANRRIPGHWLSWPENPKHTAECSTNSLPSSHQCYICGMILTRQRHRQVSRQAQNQLGFNHSHSLPPPPLDMSTSSTLLPHP